MRFLSVDSRTTKQRGSAMIEFLLLGILLLVPLSLGMTDLSNYFNALMAGESAAREAVRGYAMADNSQIGEVKAHEIALLVLSDSNVGYRDFTLRIRCSSMPCLTPGGTISASVDFRVDLRFLSPTIHVLENEPISSWNAVR